MSSKIIDDLFWCIGSEELIQSRDNFFSCNEHKIEFVNTVREVIAKQPDQIEQRLGQALGQLKTRRLGERFERFIRFAFELHPNYQVLQHNLPIRKDKVTLGELDLVVSDAVSGNVFHIELACKYYLALPSATTSADYIGPGLADRLDRKLKRLFEHQLTLSRRVECRSVLSEHDCPNLEPRCILRGRIFNPWENQQQALAEPLNKQVETGFWSIGENLSRLNNEQIETEQALSLYRLNKHEWFALVSNQSESLQLSHADEELNEFRQTAAQYAVALAAFQAKEPVTQCFLVPDNWLAEANEIRLQSVNVG